jgi:tRNA A-37 threonylcarbamoyl transferase component Bud32
VRQDSLEVSERTQQQIMDICRHIAGSAKITALGLFRNYMLGLPNAKTTLEIVLVIRDYKPRSMSYFNVLDRRLIVIFAVDQWIFERDVERGFLGEAFAGTLVFPYTTLYGKDYLEKQELILKKRLILELIENLVFSFPELCYNIRIKPEYFMYEVMLNRVRVFPPLANSISDLSGAAAARNFAPVLQGYIKAVEQLEIEKKIAISDGFVTIPKRTIMRSQNQRVHFLNLAKNAPRTFFTSFVKIFPQLMTFLSQNSESLLYVQRLILKKGEDNKSYFVDPKKYVFLPTSKGLVTLADRVDIETFARKVLLDGRYSRIKVEPIGGVLNDVYLISASQDGADKKVLVKRFKDWSGFKWFPLSMWSLGARTFAVLARSRLARECAISELLRCSGFNVPRILHVNTNERLVFMEYLEGEDLSYAIKRIATSNDKDMIEKELDRIGKVGGIFARVHSLNVTLGDTKPENVMINPSGEIYLLDFEQASRSGDKSWDIAEFLYYSGHYLQPLAGVEKAESISASFIEGYLKGGGEVNTIRKSGASKYTRVFSIFTLPSVVLAISNTCKRAEALKQGA